MEQLVKGLLMILRRRVVAAPRKVERVCDGCLRTWIVKLFIEGRLAAKRAIAEQCDFVEDFAELGVIFSDGVGQ